MWWSLESACRWLESRVHALNHYVTLLSLVMKEKRKDLLFKYSNISDYILLLMNDTFKKLKGTVYLGFLKAYGRHGIYLSEFLKV